MIARDSRLKRAAARPGTGLDPKGESGGAEGNRPKPCFWTSDRNRQVDAEIGSIMLLDRYYRRGGRG